MTVSVVQCIKANLVIEVGMRVRYDCPGSGDSYESDRFFKKYEGRTGIIVGFPTEFVAPLDMQGRLPGVYYTTRGINVRFDGEGETHPNLNIQHFVLLSPAQTIDPTTPPTHQRAGDLPQPIFFYPGDIVYKTDDLFRQPRRVERVSIGKDGKPIYHLVIEKEEEDDFFLHNRRCVWRKNQTHGDRQYPPSVHRSGQNAFHIGGRRDCLLVARRPLEHGVRRS